MITTSTTSRQRTAIAVLTVALACVGAPSAFAQHRARIDAALADHIAAGSQSIDVIVHGSRASVDTLAGRYNLVVKRYLRSGAVLTVTAGQAVALQGDEDVDHLSVDVRLRSMAVDPVDEAIGADQVWAGAAPRRALSGKGVGVAIIDSGVDPSHEALRGRVVRTVDFTGGDGIDRFGHGTHVAALIAGNPGATSDTADYRGVAFGASIINLRVLGADGSGSASDVIEAIDWAIEHQHEYNINVINLSMGAPVLQPFRDDPLCEAVERAVTAGLVVVTAAGNHGRTTDGRPILGGITSPGNSPYAITVGALDTNQTADRSDDRVATFSSAGPTRFDLVIKPDLVAPGRHVTSAEAAGSYLAANFPEQHVAGQGASAYMWGSGTSMSAAIVSGAVALLLEERPGLQPWAVKAALQTTSSFLPEAGLVRGGAGSLNVASAADFVRTAAPQVSGGGSSAIDRQLAITEGGAVVLTNSESVAGNGDTVVWGESNTVVWGNSDTVVWGNSDTVVWGL